MNIGTGPNDEIVTEVPLGQGRKILIRVNPRTGYVKVEGASEVDAVHRFRVDDDVVTWNPDDGVIVRSRFRLDDVEIEVHREQGKKWWWPLPKLRFFIGHRGPDLKLQNKIEGWFRWGDQEQKLGFAPDREAIQEPVTQR